MFRTRWFWKFSVIHHGSSVLWGFCGRDRRKELDLVPRPKWRKRDQRIPKTVIQTDSMVSFVARYEMTAAFRCERDLPPDRWWMSPERRSGEDEKLFQLDLLLDFNIFQCHMVKTLVGTRYIKVPQVIAAIAGIAGCLFPHMVTWPIPMYPRTHSFRATWRSSATSPRSKVKRSRGHQSPHRSVSSSSHSINLITVYQVVCHFHLLFLTLLLRSSSPCVVSSYFYHFSSSSEEIFGSHFDRWGAHLQLSI